MRKTAIFPPGSRPQSDLIKVSPAIISGDHVFFTGITGSLADGSMPDDPAHQIESAFHKIGSILAEAALTFDHIVEMTSYHVGIADHFDMFCDIRAQFVSEPYPAWTAVEVAGLRRTGAIVEIRVVAQMTAAEIP